MLAQALEEVAVYPSPFDPILNRVIYEAAEYVTNGQTTRLNLLRPERFLQACLELKHRSGAYMPQGKLVLESVLGRLLIRNDGTFTVQKTERPVDLTLAQDEVYGLLFGPSPRVFAPYSAQLGALGAWFPLPFYIHFTDL